MSLLRKPTMSRRLLTAGLLCASGDAAVDHQPMQGRAAWVWERLTKWPSFDSFKSRAQLNAQAKDECKESLAEAGPYEAYTYHGSFFQADSGESLLTCRHGNYLTAFDLELRAPSWSAYHITPEEANQEHGGRMGFRQDPTIPDDNQAPVDSHCWGNTWNRGHLAPSYIMSYNKHQGGSWEDTYYITNTAMQYGPFNQRTWEHLEEHVANWIRKNNKDLYIVTGTAFRGAGDKDNTSELVHHGRSHDPALLTKCDIQSGEITGPGDEEIEQNTGDGEVILEKARRQLRKEEEASYMGVPDYYYKAVCDLKAGKSVVFLGHNRQDDGVHEVSMNELRDNFSGLNLFPESCNLDIAAGDYFWEEDGKPKRSQDKDEKHTPFGKWHRTFHAAEGKWRRRFKQFGGAENEILELHYQ